MVINQLVTNIEITGTVATCTRMDGSTFDIQVFEPVDASTLPRKASIYISDVPSSDDAELGSYDGSTVIKSTGEVLRRENGEELVTRRGDVLDPILAQHFQTGSVYHRGDFVLYKDVFCSINTESDIEEAKAITDMNIQYQGIANGSEIGLGKYSGLVKDTNSIHFTVGTTVAARTLHGTPIASNHTSIPPLSSHCLLLTATEGLYILNNKLYDIITGDELLVGVTHMCKYLNKLTIVFETGDIKTFRIGNYSVPVKIFPKHPEQNTISSISTYCDMLAVFYSDTKKLIFYFTDDINISEEIQLEASVTECFYDGTEIYVIETNSMKVVPVSVDILPFDSSFIFSKPICANSFSHLLTYYPSTSNATSGFRTAFKGSDLSEIIDIDSDSSGNIYAITGSKLFKIRPTSATFDLSGFSKELESSEDVFNAKSIVCVGDVLYISFASSKVLRRYNKDTLTYLGTLERAVSGSEIQSIGRGQTGDISILTDVGTFYLYASITDPDPIKVSDFSSSITSESKACPLSVDGAWVTETTVVDSNIYKVFYTTGLADQFIRIPSTGPKTLSVLGTQLITVDLFDEGTIATYDSYIETIKEG